MLYAVILLSSCTVTLSLGKALYKLNLLLSMLKKVVQLTIFVETVMPFFQDSLINRKLDKNIIYLK